jgi:hypothetical protein
VTLVRRQKGQGIEQISALQGAFRVVNLGSDWDADGGRNNSPWHPTLRWFRQQTPGDWSTVIRPVPERLQARDLAP